MSIRFIKMLIGLLLLFGLYHTAEYYVLFAYSPLAFLFFQIAFFIMAWLLAKWHGFSGLSAWGLDTRKGWITNLVFGMVMGMVLYGGTFAVSVILKGEQVLGVPALKTFLPQLALFCFGTFFSSFSEDVLTRGYLYKHIGNKVPAWAFIIISSIVYLLNHIYRLGEGGETWLYIFLLGVLFALPVIITKRLWLTGGMHWIGNTTFFYTHSVIKVKESGGPLAPNTIFIICILLFIPIVLLLLRLCKKVLL